MSAVLLKISSEVLAAVGATSAEDFPARLVSRLQSNAEAIAGIADLKSKLESATTKLASVESSLASARSDISAHGLSISGLTAELGKPVTISEAHVKAWANEAGTAAGSKIAMQAVGGLGMTPPAPASAPAKTGEESATFNGLLKAGKYEEAYAAAAPDSQVKKEFSDAKSYALFMRFDSRGQLKVSGKNHQ